MKVTIEKIEVDRSEIGPPIWWVTAQAEDDTGPYYWDVFAVEPNVWDLILGVAEMCRDEGDEPGAWRQHIAGDPEDIPLSEDIQLEDEE